MQGAQKLRSEAHLQVRRNDEVAAQRRRWTFYETINPHCRGSYQEAMPHACSVEKIKPDSDWKISNERWVFKGNKREIVSGYLG